MLKYVSQNRRTYYFLFAFCFGFVWYLFKLGGLPNPWMALLSTAIDICFSLAVLVITVELLLPRLFYERYYLFFGASFLIAVIVAGSCTILLQLKLAGYNLSDYQRMISRYKEHYYYWFWSDLVFGSYFLISFIALSGFAIRLSFDRILVAKKIATLEGEKGRAELEMLKSQINPHFLFNALNTIYYKIERSNAPARGMVEKFSSLLRYQLYECNEIEVPVEKELKFITDYIELQKERFGTIVQVNYDTAQNVKGFFIPPFLLMPLVENCFKHISQYPDKENHIGIQALLQSDFFFFGTTNTVSEAGDGNKTGIGLENVSKRLKLIYPGKHSLAIEKKDGIFLGIIKDQH